MLSSFRRLSKSTVGSIIMVLFVLAIVASFALTDMSNVGAGSIGQSGSTLVKVGAEQITDREMSRAMERRLTEVRQQNPNADYATIGGDFDPLLASVIDMRTLEAFGNKFGFNISKRLVDAEIANLPGAKGLGGTFTDESYQRFLSQQRMSDIEVRQLLGGMLSQRLLLTPIAANSRMPVGVARPYASMLLEGREAEVANVPVQAFLAGLQPTDADLQRHYAANRARYMVPEQRVLRLARIGPEQVASIAASDQEIAAYYKANQATYGSKDLRTISQAVVPDQNTANAIAGRARGGQALAAAAAPAGLSAADVTVGPQTRAQFAGLAGEKAAAAAFAAQSGAVVGPIQTDLGWHVVKVEAVRSEGGKSLAAAKAEIAAKLTADKRKEALADLITRVEDALAEGSNFAEAAAVGKVPVTETPLITAAGTKRDDPSFKLPPELAGAVKAGFEMAADDEPVVDTLPNETGYVMVAPARIVAAAPAPLAEVRARVAEDWINSRASERAKAVASAIAAKVARGVPMAQAIKEAGVRLPGVLPIAARRIDLSRMGNEVPAALRMMFSLSQGKSRLVADPEGRGFSIVKVNKIVAGNALTQPSLIARVQSDFQQALSQEYAQQFLAAARKAVGVRRNEEAIAATKKRITGG